MKITKTLLTIALVALTTTLFGRIGGHEADCYCCPTELFLDQDQGMEKWMSEPFESSFEYDLVMESWMSVLFEADFEGEVSLESWMIIPFNSTEEIEFEQWMAATWF